MLLLPLDNMTVSQRLMWHGLRSLPFNSFAWRVMKKVMGRRERLASTFAGEQMIVSPADFIGAYLYHFGVWEPHLSALITSSLNPGDVFCDLGANIGYYTVLAAPIVGRAGKVVSIEPSAGTFATLLRNVALNNIDNARLVNVAVSDQPGTLTLYSRRGNQVRL